MFSFRTNEHLPSTFHMIFEGNYFDPNSYYWLLTAQLQDDQKCLDMLDDSRYNNPNRLMPTHRSSEQYWKFVRLNNEYYRLHTQ